MLIYFYFKNISQYIVIKACTSLYPALTNPPTIPVGVTLSDGICISGSKIFELKAAVSSTSTPQSCQEITGEILVGSDGKTKVAFSASNAAGLLYKCTDGSCKQIKSGSYYYDDDTNKLLFTCDSSTSKCTSEAITSLKGFYLNGSTASTGNTVTYSKLIYCNGSGACSNDVTIQNGFYPHGPNSSGYTNLIKCDSNGCKVDSPTKDGIYFNVYESDSTGYKNLLKYTSSTNKFVDVTINAGDVFLDASTLNSDGSAKKIIKCGNESPNPKCKSEDGSTDPGKGYLDAGSTSTTNGFENVIICTGTTTIKCSSKEKGNATGSEDTPANQNTAFINAAADSGTKKLIICSETECKKGSPSTTLLGHAYLDGTKFKNSKFTGIITCSGSTCSPLASPSTSEGHVYIDAGSEASGAYSNVIRCSGKTSISCESSDGTTGVTFIDATNTENIIICDSSINTTETCKSDSNGSDENNNIFYLDGICDDTNRIIVCTKSDKCISQIGNTTKNVIKYYPNSADKTTIIKCEVNKGACTNTDNNVATTAGYYIDGYTGGLLGCDSSDYGCKPVEDVVTGDLTGYIHFDTKTIIQCVKVNSETVQCTAMEEVDSDDDESYYYINAPDKSKIITCQYDSGNSVSVCDSTTTIVDIDTTPAVAYFNKGGTKVIQCSNDEEVDDIVCKVTGPTSLKPKVNYIDVIGTDKIITCENGSSCEVDDGEDGVAYIDYVNDGYIIICDTSAVSPSSKCTSTENPSIEGDDETPVQNACYIDGYDNKKQTLITCTRTENGSSCVSKKLTSFTETYAYLDGSSFASNKFSQLLKLKSSKEIEVISSPLLGADGIAYIDGTDKNKKRIITCATGDCKVMNNGSSVATEDTEEVNAFYIDGVNIKQIIICTPNAGCKSEIGNKAGADFDSYYPDSQKEEQILKCLKDGTKCEKATALTAPTTEAFYIDGYTNENVVKCESNSICVEIKGNSTPGYGYIDYGNSSSGNIIVCKNNSCASKGNGFSTGQNTVFIDASKEDYTSIIKCTTATTCTPESISSLDTGIAFLDGTSVNTNNKVTNLITCDDENETCFALASLGKKPKTEKGYVYIDGTSNNSGYKNVIQCTSDKSVITCTSEAVSSDKAKPEYGYIDATDERTPITRIISCGTSGCESSENESVEAEKDDNGKITTAAVNQFFINGKKDTKIIACTKESGCSSIDGSKKLKEKKYYIDSKTVTNIISCEGPSTEGGTPASCKSAGHADTTGNNVYYIDGYDTKNILICNKDDGCVSSLSLATETQPSHYVDSGGESSKPVIITCTATECTSGSGITDPGTAYLDPIVEGNVITCESGKACKSDVGLNTGKSDTYIDAGDASQIVYCSGEECKYFSTKPTENDSEYYARLSSGINELIECDFNSTVSKKSSCKLEKTNAPKPNFVYKNYLFGKEGGDDTNPLIICDVSSKCIPSTATIDGENKSYYINSDLQSVEKKLNGDIIECTEESKECKILPGNDSEVYLNANFNSNNKKQVIICKSEVGCLEYKTNSTTSDYRYYINSGSKTKKSLEDTLIECKDTCQILPANDGEIYVNEFDNSQTIQCYKDKGCISVESKATETKNEIFLNSSDLKAENEKALEKDLIKCQNKEGKIECKAENGNENEVYINSHNTTEIIYCTSEGCNAKASEAEANKPEFYINADPSDDDPLSGDLIKCKNTGSKINCEVIDGVNGDVFLNSNVENDNNKKPLIVCSEESGCKTDSSKASDGSLPIYYVNSGSSSSSKLNEALIKCSFEEGEVDCSVISANANDVYVNYADDADTNPLIKCNKNGCKSSPSNATEESKEYYINAGDSDDKVLDYDIIECTNADGKIKCIELDQTGVGVYLNSNYAENGDKNQLIQCKNDSGCEGIQLSSEKSMGYYVNAEASDLTNALIFCSSKKCEKQTVLEINTYFVGVGEDGEVNGLIECIEFEESNTALPTTEATTVIPETKRKRATEKRCKLKSPFTSSGFYLNSGYNKSVNQTIVCDSSDGCETRKVDLGYYVNAGDSSKPIIKCEKESTECVAEESEICPENKDAEPGKYCYEDNQLKFYPASNTTAVSASKSDAYYTFATIPSGGFPGIKSETGALFKISQYYINRFYQNGVVMIDKNGKLVDNLSADQSDISIYDCNDSIKTCNERAGCTQNTYMYDTENEKAVFCNSGKLEYAEFTGYVVDGNRAVGTNHPYIIECANDGKKCQSFKPKISSYYENSGYDSTTNSLIQCSNNNCITISADVGYYVGHEGDGIIQCTSSSSCTYTKAKSKVKYVNAGSNKSSNAIISCVKNGCSAIKANVGYYLTYSSSLLIQCTSPSSCVEFTPTVNYYDNADSSESSNSIINCVQSSQVISCALEATNNGFYMSSAPNVLIRCKSGSKCKTVTVKNGIFRGAIKGLLGGSKRSIEDDSVEEKKEIRTNKEIELREEEEEDGMSIAMPRDSDDVYGIIRCVAGKCSALSASEIASIPVCEFNNNKCYITLEYAMTKSATTSITAGNICTNADRSVFYFATDTIVVKPNVISGITATYVYTTTNSNCLEVNDSYTDMYFTVGSNIYLLDQGSVLQFYESGYYFINTAKNSLVSGNDIDAYNDENVKLYKCNGSSCSITDKPDAMTYYADVNKRIIRYNINSDSYSFAYEKDITCIFANNKCTPNADLKNQEFCITYKGELALAKQDIKNRETGECYKASSITNGIYGYSQHLYNMNLYSAKMVDETGYYIVSLSTNTTVVSKNYKTKNNNLVVYGCQLSSCKEYTPDENTYYYDARAKNILRYKDGIWSSPSTSGYAYISIDPTTTYIYRFTKNLDDIKINAMANYGYYYTVDGEMYHCDRDENGECSPIDNTGYYFTNAGEVYYCVHDSEELEPTECT